MGNLPQSGCEQTDWIIIETYCSGPTLLITLIKTQPIRWNNATGVVATSRLRLDAVRDLPHVCWEWADGEGEVLGVGLPGDLYVDVAPVEALAHAGEVEVSVGGRKPRVVVVAALEALEPGRRLVVEAGEAHGARRSPREGVLVAEVAAGGRRRAQRRVGRHATPWRRRLETGGLFVKVGIRLLGGVRGGGRGGLAERARLHVGVFRRGPTGESGELSLKRGAARGGAGGELVRGGRGGDRAGLVAVIVCTVWSVGCRRVAVRAAYWRLVLSVQHVGALNSARAGGAVRWRRRRRVVMITQ